MREREKAKAVFPLPLEGQKGAFPTSPPHGLLAISLNQNRSESVKDVPGLNCKECPRPYILNAPPALSYLVGSVMDRPELPSLGLWRARKSRGRRFDSCAPTIT